MSVALLVIACQQQAPDDQTANVSPGVPEPAGSAESKAEEPPAPTIKDAALALSVPGVVPGNWTRYEVGAPTECVNGLLNGQLVLSCSVCAVHLFRLTDPMRGSYGWTARNAYYNLAFKRAVSSGQPDIAPMSPDEGVWVLAGEKQQLSGRAQAATFNASLEHPIDTINVAHLGLDASSGDLSRVEGDRTIYYHGEALSQILMSDEMKKVVTDVVGNCPST